MGFMKGDVDEAVAAGAHATGAEPASADAPGSDAPGSHAAGSDATSADAASADTGQGGSLARFKIVADYLYAVDSHTINVFDISDLEAPVELAYTVQNFLIGPGKGLPVTLTVAGQVSISIGVELGER